MKIGEMLPIHMSTARPGQIRIRGIWFPADWITEKFL